MPSKPPEGSLRQLDTVDLSTEFGLRIPTLRSCPNFLRGRWRHALCHALEARRDARAAGDKEEETRAWKLFGLLPTLLLHRPREAGDVGRAELEKRFN